MTSISQTVFLSCLFLLAASLTTTPTFVNTDKYMETGSFTVDTSPYYNNGSLTSIQSTTFDLTFSNARTNYQGAVNFQEVFYDISAAGLLNVTIRECGQASNKLTVCLLSSSLNKLKSLKIRYLLRDLNFIKFVVYKLRINHNPGVAISSGSPYEQNFPVPRLDNTSTVQKFVAFSGFNLTSSTGSWDFDLKVSVTQVALTSVKVSVSAASGTLTIMGLYLSYLQYNQFQAEFWPFPSAQVTYTDLNGINSISPSDTNVKMTAFNVWWGFSRFTFTGQPSLHIDSAQTGTTVSGSSSLAFANLDLTILIFQFKQCHVTTPFYGLFDDTCYDVCLKGSNVDLTAKTCIACTSYDCSQCSGTLTDCTVCDAADFRVLNASTSRCDPMPGYFDDGGNNALAQQCNNNCSRCVGITTDCTDCVSGYFLLSKVCYPCITSCSVCPNSVSCTTCISNYVYNGTVCIPYTPSSGFPLYLMILIPCLVVVCLSIFICIFCICRRRKNGKSKIEDNPSNNQQTVKIEQSFYKFQTNQIVFQQNSKPQQNQRNVGSQKNKRRQAKKQYDKEGKIIVIQAQNHQLSADQVQDHKGLKINQSAFQDLKKVESKPQDSSNILKNKLNSKNK